MAKGEKRRLEVRYSQPFHLTLAFIGFGLSIGAGLWLLIAGGLPVATEGANAGKPGFDGRLMLVLLSVAGLLYYSVRSVFMLRNRAPQLTIDRDGIVVGFGRDIHIPWNDVQWARVRGTRRTMQFGVSPEIFLRMRASLFNLDDPIAQVPGGGSAFAVRGGGLDASCNEMLDVVKAWRPTLPKR